MHGQMNIKVDDIINGVFRQYNNTSYQAIII